MKAPARYLKPDPAAGLAATASYSLRIPTNWATRLRGVFQADVAGTLTIRWWSINPATPGATHDLEYDVAVCPAQPNSTYHFDVIRQGGWADVIFTQGGTPSTFLRAEVTALVD